jgi:integrase
MPPYHCRHTHATLLLKNGVPVKVVSERLGHANVQMTLTNYQDVLPDMQDDAVKTFERIMKRA